MVKCRVDDLEDVPGIVSEMLEPYDEGLRVDAYVDKDASEVQAEFDRIKDEVDNWPAGKDVPSYLQKYMNGAIHQLTVEDWAKNWYGQSMDADGNLLTEYNPDSKWDWYEIGGRWFGYITLKEGRVGIKTKPSWGWSKEDIDKVKDRFDIAYIKDIDFDTILERQKEDAASFWDKTMAEGKGYYYNTIKDTSRDDYIAKAATGLTAFAVVDDMGWHEPAKMGWFGCLHSENEDENVWDERFMERFLTDYTDDTAIAIVDCHI